jgi:hypothetical protein
MRAVLQLACITSLHRSSCTLFKPLQGCTPQPTASLIGPTWQRDCFPEQDLQIAIPRDRCSRCRAPPSRADSQAIPPKVPEHLGLVPLHPTEGRPLAKALASRPRRDARQDRPGILRQPYQSGGIARSSHPAFVENCIRHCPDQRMGTICISSTSASTHPPIAVQSAASSRSM